MSGRQLSLGHHPNHRIRQPEQAKKVRDRCAVLPGGIGNLLMSKLEFLDESLVTARLVDRVEIAALQVLDEREHETRAIVEILDQRRNLRPAEVGDRPQPPLAGDELVCIAGSSYCYRLQEPTSSNRSFELGEFFRIKDLARLKRV